jgi:hypothetical protein
MLSFDTDDILFTILNASEELKETISGGIYVQGERPDNSEREDIVINNIVINHDYPQSGTSNVNIHVEDLKLKIKGQEQRKADRERLRFLTDKVVRILKAANIQGLTFWIENETVIKEPAVFQHYTNLRINWNIHK